MYLKIQEHRIDISLQTWYDKFAFCLDRSGSTWDDQVCANLSV